MTDWISVKTRLPYGNEDVLVWVVWPTRAGNVDTSFLDEEGNWAMGSAKRFEVTHWMPLPEGPEEEA